MKRTPWVQVVVYSLVSALATACATAEHDVNGGDEPGLSTSSSGEDDSDGDGSPLSAGDAKRCTEMLSINAVCVDCDITVDWSGVATDYDGNELDPASFTFVHLFEFDDVDAATLEAGLCDHSISSNDDAQAKYLAGVQDLTSIRMADGDEGAGLPAVGEGVRSILLSWVNTRSQEIFTVLEPVAGAASEIALK